MRLGSKKRVVFQMIADGLESIEDVSEHLHESDISSRNVRDIVRDGIRKGDIHGEVEGRFLLSEFGNELLAKAALEDDWDKYEHLVEYEGPPSSDEDSGEEDPLEALAKSIAGTVDAS